MKASLGDRVLVASGRPGHSRLGRVVQLRHPDGTPPYVVLWADTGLESLYFPKADGVVEHVEGAEAEVEVAEPDEGVRVAKTWHVDLYVTETGTQTSVRAILHEDEDAGVVASVGRAVRDPEDPNIPEVGDELAVGRALQRLSETLVQAAESTLAAVHEHDAHLAVDFRAADVDVR